MKEGDAISKLATILKNNVGDPDTEMLFNDRLAVV
jgi:hypothetical protein